MKKKKFLLLFFTQLHLVEGDEQDSPRPAEYKTLVNANRTAPVVLTAVEKRDLSTKLNVRVALNVPDGMHFTDGVDSKVQVSLSDDGKLKNSIIIPYFVCIKN